MNINDVSASGVDNIVDNMNNIPLEVFTARNADVCSFVLVSRLFGLALEADRHVPRLILQDVATRILHRV